MSKHYKLDQPRPVPVAFQQDMEELIGYLLTQIDASVLGSNKEALKSLIKQGCWKWYGDLQDYTEAFKQEKRCSCDGIKTGCTECSILVANKVEMVDDVPVMEDIPTK